MKIVPLDKLLPVKDNVNSKQCYNTRSESVKGILIHFDASSSDTGSLQWFRDPACRVSYNRLYFDDGSVAQITPTMINAAWHAGVCKPSSPLLKYTSGNSAFYGLSIAANNNDVVTAKQLESLASDCVAIFKYHGWTNAELWRITGHESECFPRGRKIDPTGTRPDKPVLNIKILRDMVSSALGTVDICPPMR